MTDRDKLRQEIKTIHDRYHGRIRTHQEVGKHAQWTGKELQGVLDEDEALFYSEIMQRLEAELAREVRTIFSELKEQVDASYGTDSNFAIFVNMFIATDVESSLQASTPPAAGEDKPDEQL